MIVVRNCFVARPGMASKLASQLKEAQTAAPTGIRSRVLTDLTGDFNRVILEHEAENIAAFEEMMRVYGSDTALREKMKGYTDLYVTGSREILQIA